MWVYPTHDSRFIAIAVPQWLPSPLSFMDGVTQRVRGENGNGRNGAREPSQLAGARASTGPAEITRGRVVAFMSSVQEP